MFEHFSFTKSPDRTFSFNLCIGAHESGENLIPGTATFITKNLAITAKHVMTLIYEKFNQTIIKFPEMGKTTRLQDKKTSIILLQFFGKKNVPGIWGVKNVFLAPNTDIAYILLTPINNEAKNYQWTFPEIDLHPPRIGSKITAYGFIDMHGKVINGVTEWSANSALTTGVVRKIHHKKRDCGMLSFPVINTNAHFEHGMSGGPVYNEEGRLFAIVCDCLPSCSRHEEHVSYASLIWPSLVTPIHELEMQEISAIYHLYNSKNIHVRNLNQVEFNNNGKGIGFRYLY